MSAGLSVRRAHPDENAAVAAVILAANPHLNRRIATFLTRGAHWHDVTPVVGELDGAIASCACIFHREMWVGQEQKRFGGIGAVATRPDARGKGMATLVLGECESIMRGSGYDVVILFCSIVAFYQRLGWEMVAEEYVEFDFPRQSNTTRYQLRPVAIAAIPDLIRALGTSFSQSAIVRGDELWREYADWQRDDADLFWAAYDRDEPVAYARGRRWGQDRGTIQLLDAAARPDGADAWPALLDQQRQNVAQNQPVKFRGNFASTHPIVPVLEQAGIQLARKPTSPEFSVMMRKSLRDTPAPGFLCLDDFRVGLPWPPRTWWAVDRF